MSLNQLKIVVECPKMWHEFVFNQLAWHELMKKQIIWLGKRTLSLEQKKKNFLWSLL
jgi:hypothetical protein